MSTCAPAIFIAETALGQYTELCLSRTRFPEFLINRVRSALTKAFQAVRARFSCHRRVLKSRYWMLQLVTLGTIVAWALMVALFLLAYAPQRTMTEIIRDVESSR